MIELGPCPVVVSKQIANSREFVLSLANSSIILHAE